MKAHPVNLLIALLMSALITVAILGIEGNPNRVLTGIGCFVSLAVTSTFMFGVTFADSRIGVNLRLVSALFFVGLLMANLGFAWVGVTPTAYIVGTGFFFVMFILVSNAIYSSRQACRT